NRRSVTVWRARNRAGGAAELLGAAIRARAAPTPGRAARDRYRTRNGSVMMDNTPVRSGEPQDTDPVIWPDPSPLAGWWADVMSSGTTQRPTNSSAQN
ncbi:hypothetical protein, partial [Nocardia farcinica]